MAEPGSPTPDEPRARRLKDQVAHGPPKKWELVGRSTQCQVTAPIEMLQWLRSNGYVYSRVFRDAAAKLMGSGEAQRLEEQIEYHREQLTILEAAKTTLSSRREAEQAVEQGAQQRLDALRAIATAFFAEGRDDRSKYGKGHNLNWIRGQASKHKALKGTSAAEILETVLASKEAPK